MKPGTRVTKKLPANKARRRNAASLKEPAAPGKAAPVLYLYAISEVPKKATPVITAEDVGGGARVEAIRCGDFLCWVSLVSSDEFGETLNDRMQDLEWLALTSLRHQRVVAEISSLMGALPARFGTVFLSQASLAKHVKGRKRALHQAFRRVAEADEWGIKIFATAAAPGKGSVGKPASGADYLRRKAQLLQPRGRRDLDAEVQQFIAAVTKLAAATTPGGKASAGQPGLLWHGSLLVRRKNRGKLESALRKYAARWKDARRIDCSGPWPPYSFVGEHVQ